MSQAGLGLRPILGQNIFPALCRYATCGFAFISVPPSSRIVSVVYAQWNRVYWRDETRDNHPRDSRNSR